MSKSKTLFVFDIDDTLTKTAKLHQIAFVEALREMGVVEIDTRFNEYLHHTDSFIAKTIYEKDKKLPFNINQLEKLEQLLEAKILLKKIKEIEGATSLIKRIQDSKNHDLCFATGSLLAPALIKLDKIGIEDYENIIVASNSYHKRESIVKGAILKAEQQNQTNYKHIISFGDGIWDYITANNLGIDFVGVGATNQDQLKKSGAHVLLNNLTEYKL